MKLIKFTAVLAFYNQHYYTYNYKYEKRKTSFSIVFIHFFIFYQFPLFFKVTRFYTSTVYKAMVFALDCFNFLFNRLWPKMIKVKFFCIPPTCYNDQMLSSVLITHIFIPRLHYKLLSWIPKMLWSVPINSKKQTPCSAVITLSLHITIFPSFPIKQKSDPPRNSLTHFRQFFF